MAKQPALPAGPPAFELKPYTYKHHEVRVAREGRAFRGVVWDRERTSKLADERADDLPELKARLEAAVDGMVAARAAATAAPRKGPSRTAPFAGIEGAVARFLEVYPGGFGDRLYLERERAPKDSAAAFVAERLSGDRIAVGAPADVAAAALAALTHAGLNLASSFDRNKLKAALADPAVAAGFAPALAELLHGDFDAGLERLTALLRPRDAAKWSVLTFWPFLLHPDRHMILQPTLAQDAAAAMGHGAGLAYDPAPNRRTYDGLLGLAALVREGAAALEPKDNIDVQGLLAVAARPAAAGPAAAGPAVAVAAG